MVYVVNIEVNETSTAPHHTRTHHQIISHIISAGTPVQEAVEQLIVPWTLELNIMRI